MKKSVLTIVVILGLILALSCTFVTNANEYNLVKRFGKIEKIIETPGISLKIPFIDKVDTLPKTVMLYDLAVSDVITKDKKTMIADSFVLWEINDPLLFTKTLDGKIGNAEYRINTVVYNSLKNVISNMSQEEIIMGRDGELAVAIRDNIGDLFLQYGIALYAVETKQLDLPNDNKEAVYQRMISERDKIAATFIAEGESEAKKLKNDADKQVAILLSEAQATADKLTAEGESEYMKILSVAYDTQSKADFYEFIRSLDAAKGMLKGSNKTLILDKSSPIAQIFYK